MADILCPSCGKPNPDALEICQYCGALLKNRGTEPLAPIHPGEAPTPKKTAELERTLPAWLRDIRKDGAADSAGKAPVQPPAAPPAVPPVNSRPPAPPAPAPKSASPLDLLAGLSQDDEEEAEVPDWMAGLKSSLPGGPVPSPEPGAIKPQPGAVVPGEQPAAMDWLAGLQAESQPPEQASQQPPATSSEFDAGPVSFTESQEPAAPIAGATPDWLGSLQSQDSKSAASQPGAAQPPASAPASDFPPIEGLPDWLNGLVGEADTPQNAPAATPAPPLAPAMPAAPAPADTPFPPPLTPIPGPLSPAVPAAGDLPDWLSSGPAVPVSPVASSPAENLPDWLPSVPATPAPQAADLPPTGDLPDWMTGQAPPAFSGPPAPAAPEAAASSAELPDWLANLGGGAPPSAAPSEPAAVPQPPASQPAPAETGLPDWMAGGPAQEKAAEPPAPADLSGSKAFGTGSLQELGPLGTTGGLPEWMAGLSIGGAAASNPAASQPETKRPAVEPSAPPSQDAGAFEWPGKTGAGESKPAETPAQSTPEAGAATGAFSVPAGENDQNLDAILSMDMPDWLSGFAPTETDLPGPSGEQQAPAPAASGANISPADLPSWVQAMRPMETVVTGGEGGADDQNVEKEGPLAGIRSVLPAQPEGLGARKPRPYSIKLQVDPAQQARAALLENLIASEAESQPVALPSRVLVIRPLRWTIAAMLVVLVLIGAVLPLDIQASIFPAPAVEAGSAVSQFQQVIKGLPDSAPVLVVFDYQPGYAGELEQAAGPAINDLISHNARLAFVSTSPLGSLMSQRMLDQHPDKNQFADLGYLPGEAAGIQVFASNPQILGTPDAWTALGVGKFSDFKTVVVLTDNADIGRQWIEQTSKVMRDQAETPPPMLMVISTQAEPIIDPYLASGQIQGLVTGLAGGVAYQQSGTYWGSYGLGLIAAEILIAIGGVIAIIGNLRARRTEREQAEEDEA